MLAGNALLAVLLVVAVESPVRGIVRAPGGEPVKDADVWLLNKETEPPETGHSTTDGEGRFAVNLPADAGFGRLMRFQILAYRPALGMASVDVDTRNLPRPPIALTLQRCTSKTFRFINPKGEPLRDAVVIVRSLLDSQSHLYSLPGMAAGPFARRTDGAGEVTFELIESMKSARLVVDAPGYGKQSVSGRIDPSSPPIRLLPVGTLRGRVTANDRSQTAGVRLSIQSAPRHEGSAVYVSGSAEVGTDAEGRFEFAQIVAGDVRVTRVQPTENSPLVLEKEVQGKLEAGAALDVEIPLVRGVRVVGTVIDQENGKPIAGARVHFGGNAAGALASDAASRTTDKEGHYESYMRAAAGRIVSHLDRLPAPYVAARSEVFLKDIPAGVDELELPPFVVKVGVILPGIVVDAEQRPVPLARVQAGWVSRFPGADGRPASAAHLAIAESDGRGKFTIGPVDNDWPLAFWAFDDFRTSAKIVEIEPWKSDQSIILPIVADGLVALSGRVFDRDGHPVSGIEITIGSDMERGKWDFEGAKALRPVGWLRTTTDRQGNYALPFGVPRLGRYSISTSFARPGRLGRAPPMPINRMFFEAWEFLPGPQTLNDLVLNPTEK